MKEYRDGKGVLIGRADGKFYYTARIPHDHESADGTKRKGHYYKKGQGYPISTSILQDLKQEGVQWVVITEHARNTITTKSIILQEYLDAPPFKHPPFDTQKCVPWDRMVKVEGKLQ